MKTVQPPIKGYWLAGAVFAALWALCAWPWLSGRVTIPYDAKALFQVQLQFLANALHSGQSPAWNPHNFVGVPQIADPQSLIFSPAILLAWLSPDPGFWKLDVYTFSLLAVAGLAILALFRDHGWHPGGGLVAAMCFTFGGSAFWRVQHIGQITSYVFFGLALWLLTRAMARNSMAWGACAGLAIGLMIVQPDQVAMLACYLLAVVVLVGWRTFSAPGRYIPGNLALLLAATIVTIVVAAWPVALTYTFLAGSNRPSITLAEAARGSIHPASLMSFFVADLYGVAREGMPYWGPFSDPWNPNELSLSANMCQLYLGALPALLLVGPGVARGQLWHRDVRPYVVAAIISLVYALGGFTPIYAILYEVLPGVALFRRPADATFMVGGFLAILAGYLVHRWLSDASSATRPTGLWLEAALIATMLGLGAAIAIWQAQLARSLWPLAAAAVWLLAGLALLAMPRDRLKSLGAAGALLPVLFVAGDLAVNHVPNESTGKPADAALDALLPQTRNATIAFLKGHVRRQPGTAWRDRVEILGIDFDWQNVAAAHGIDQTLGYNPLRTDLVTRAVSASDYSAGWDQRSFGPLFPSYRSKLADMLGLRYIACSVPLTKVDKHLAPDDLHLVARTAEAYIYENPRALPRVLFATTALNANFEQLITDGRWPDFDPRDTVLLDPAPPHPQRQPASTVEPATPDASPLAPVAAKLGREARPLAARILRYHNTEIDIAVTTHAAGYLVLNDVWHPWWQATVDGRPTPVLRANVMFRAVAVPAGRHRVAFRFSPFGGSAAALMSALFTRRNATVPGQGQALDMTRQDQH